jgi:hypothetical protein
MDRRSLFQTVLALPIFSWLVRPKPVEASPAPHEHLQWPLYRAQKDFTIGVTPPVQVEKGTILPYDGECSLWVDGRQVEGAGIKGAVRFGWLVPVNGTPSLQHFKTFG